MSIELLNITESATQKVWELIVEEDNCDLGLRVFVSGGGCSGFQYGFTFDETINEDDFVIEKVYQTETEPKTVKFLVDATSFQYLRGAEIDYKKDLQGEQFVIRNPHAKTTCGCGSSFAIE